MKRTYTVQSGNAVKGRQDWNPDPLPQERIILRLYGPGSMARIQAQQRQSNKGGSDHQ